MGGETSRHARLEHGAFFDAHGVAILGSAVSGVHVITVEDILEAEPNGSTVPDVRDPPPWFRRAVAAFRRSCHPAMYLVALVLGSLAIGLGRLLFR